MDEKKTPVTSRVRLEKKKKKTTVNRAPTSDLQREGRKPLRTLKERDSDNNEIENVSGDSGGESKLLSHLGGLGTNVW